MAEKSHYVKANENEARAYALASIIYQPYNYNDFSNFLILFTRRGFSKGEGERMMRSITSSAPSPLENY